VSAPDFLSSLRSPAGMRELPECADGWLRDDGSREPFLAYRTAMDVNWSPELEALHEKSTRDHFIDVWTRRVLVDAIRDTVGVGATVADLGCSTGYLLRDLRDAFPGAFLVGADLVAQGLRKAHAQVPDAALVLADVTELPFGDSTVSAIVSANVLEHVADDHAALAEIRRVLTPGGRAAFVVPAGPRLYDYYDAFLGHERRYRRGELAQKARRSGLVAMREVFLGSLIYPAFWLVKKSNRVRYRDASPSQMEALVRRDIARTGRSGLGARAMRVEEALRRIGVALPFGIRNLTVVEKPTGAP
jgi:ubiquinone/menaquinone biosynthesis C-methylase UbiE